MQQREILSAYMDGHQVDREFCDVLCSSSELQQQWANYHTIRSVMRGEELLLGSDFSAKMEALLKEEQITPLANQPKGRLIKLKRWGMPIMQASIAASVCLVAVVGVNMFNKTEEIVQTEQPVLQTLPFSNSVQQVSYNAPTQEQPTAEQLEYQQRRINALLQNHELQRRTAKDSAISNTEQSEKQVPNPSLELNQR